MDINNTQESRNDTITKTRFNVEEIKNINIQSMTDIIYAQKSRNDTISKTIISDEKIKNHNRKSVTNIIHNPKSTNDTIRKTLIINVERIGNLNRKSFMEPKVFSNPQTNCNNSESEEKLKQIIKERNELQKQLSLKEVQNKKLQQDMKQTIEEYDAIKDKVKNIKDHILNMLPILGINTNQ